MRGGNVPGIGPVFSSVFKAGPGWCSVVFSADRELISFSLPGSEKNAMRKVNGIPHRRFPSFEKAVREYFEGKNVDLSTFKTPLPRTPPFYKKVYLALRKVERGRVVTYGQLARKAGGSIGASRAVGGAMKNNPVPLVIPCHRVLGKGGPGGFSAEGGLEMKKRMLSLEGVKTPSP